jgi:tetratricopeptide (TPR) repeat protein
VRVRLVVGFVFSILSVFAQLPPGADLGEVEFHTSGSPAAQKFFLKGILELHNFEYDDSREDFQAARKAETGFAMAYWGEAMTYNHPLWNQQDTPAARAVLAQVPKAPTEREAEWIHAVQLLYGEGEQPVRDAAYADAMHRIHEKYPDDPDAACFYALALLGSTEGKRDYPVYMRAAAVLEEVYAKHPRHPGAAHYLIHSYDDPVHAPLGLRPARVYSKIAPAAEHAQHMPSHIFIALGMWDDVVASNEVSWSVSQERVVRKKLSVDELGYHAFSWLEYAYLQQGRYDDARHVLMIMEQNAQSSGSKRTRSSLATMRAYYLVETGQWRTQVLRPDCGDLAVGPKAADLFTAGMEGLQTSVANQTAATIEKLRAANDDASKIMADELEAASLMKHGKVEPALEKAQAAAKREDSLNFEFGPPFPVQPAHEFYGQALLEAGRAKQAVDQFQLALKRTPGRTHSLLGIVRSSLAAKEYGPAREYLGQLRANLHRADPAVRDSILAEFQRLE